MNDMITIVGNLADDPRQIPTSTGVPFTTFRVATHGRRFDRAQEKWVDTPASWYNVSAFRRLATHTLESLHKGDRVIVMGRLRIRVWDNGTKQGTSADIDADAVGHDLLLGTSTFHRTQTEGSSHALDSDPTVELAGAPRVLEAADATPF